MRFSGALIGIAAVTLALVALIIPKHHRDDYAPNPELLAQIKAQESALTALEEKKARIVDNLLDLGNADAQTHIGGYSEDQVKALLARQADSAKQIIGVTQEEVQMLGSQLALSQQMLRDFLDRRQKEQEEEKQDRRVHLIMMAVITFCTIFLFWYSLRSRSVPTWTQEVLKVAAGAVFAGWFPK
jgi:hypothetical protein